MSSRKLTSQTEIKGMESPCIRNCCLDDQDICLGCFRSLDNIIQWRGATEAQKREILRMSEIRKVNHTEKYGDMGAVFGRH